MNLAEMPKQYQLIYELSKSLFIENTFKCIVIVSKSPYLSALIACHGAKVNITPPYKKGTCLLLPKENSLKNEYIHAVIDKIEAVEGQKFYFYRFRNQRAGRKKPSIDAGSQAKSCAYIEEQGIVCVTKEESIWLGKHNVILADKNCMDNAIYPAILGQKNKVDYWQKKPLGIECSLALNMEKILNLSSQDNVLSSLSIYSTRSTDINRHDRQIWVNAVPRRIDHGNYLVVLSPNHSRFDELVEEVNDLYANCDLDRVKQSELPSNLINLGVTNRSTLLATILKEP